MTRIARSENARPIAFRKMALLRDAAIGEMSMEELATKYGVSHSSIAQWMRLHAAEVAEARDNLTDLMVTIPIANKLERLDRLETLYGITFSEIEARQERAGKLGDDKLSELINQARGILHDAMVETGQQPPRQTATSNSVTTHIVVGVDMDEFRTGGKVAVETVVDGDVLELESGDDGQDEGAA